jgi:hypothetical protein
MNNLELAGLKYALYPYLVPDCANIQLTLGSSTEAVRDKN